MGYADISARKKQVGDYLCIQTSKGNAPWRRCRMEDSRRSVFVVESFRKMVVHCPACIGNDIFKFPACFNVILIDDVITDITATFALAG
ncbi:hypothetical protein SDC9_201979 [bioreactor metagenome]|uniref:Uncharacterized protein n=1 Tax=bioreactor metagenome TaxID=1076179 RepID=A0A645IV61_9ZZZZ